MLITSHHDKGTKSPFLVFPLYLPTCTSTCVLGKASCFYKVPVLAEITMQHEL